MGGTNDRILDFILRVDSQLDKIERDLLRLQSSVAAADRMNISIPVDIQNLAREMANIRALVTQLNQLQAMDPTVDVSVQLAAAKQAINGLMSQLDAVDNRTATPSVRLNLLSTKQNLNALMDQLNEIEESRTTARVGADTSAGRRGLDDFGQIMRRYTGQWQQQGIRARVTADIGNAVTRIKTLETILKNATGTRRVFIEAEIAKAKADLEIIRGIADSVGASDPTISVRIRGVASSIAQMLGLQTLADRLDGRTITMTGKYRSGGLDNTISKVLPNALGALSLQLMNSKTIMTTLAAVTAPMMYTAFAAMPAMFSGITTAAISFGLELGMGVVGAMGQVGVAAGLAGGALLTFGVAMLDAYNSSINLTQTLGDQSQKIKASNKNVEAATAYLATQKEGTVEYEAALQGQKLAQEQADFELEKYGHILSSIGPKQVTLIQDAHKFQLAMIDLTGSITNAASPAMSKLLNTFVGFLPVLTQGATDMVGAMGDVVIAFVDTMTEGQNLNELKTIFGAVKAVGVPAITALTNVLEIVIGVIAVIVPDAVGLVGVVADLTEKAKEWTNSAEGMERIQTVWDGLREKGEILAGIVYNVAQGIYGFLAAVEASGTGNKLMTLLADGAEAFGDFMAAGGEGREIVTAFMVDFYPILEGIVELGKTAAVEFGKLVSRIMEVKEEGEQWTALEGAVRALNEILPLITDMLGKEFEHIGPLLPELIRNMGQWFAIFATATPEMLIFITTINDLMTAFNSLPDSVQKNIARIIAWTAVLSQLGILGLIAGIAGAILKFIAFQKIMGAIKASTTDVKDGLKGVDDELKEKPKDTEKAGKGFTSLKQKMLPLAPYLFLLAGRFKSIGTAILAVGPFLAKAGGFVLKLLGPIGRILLAVGRFAIVRAAFAALVSVIGGAVGAITLPVLLIVAAIAGLIAIGYAVWRNWDKIGPMLASAWEWVKTKAKAIWGSIKDFLSGIWEPVKNKAKSAWTSIKTFLSGIWAGIKTNASAAWNSIKSAASTIWTGIKVVLITALGLVLLLIDPIISGIKRLVTGAWGFIRRRTSAIWNGIAGFFRGVWSRISTFASNNAGRVKRAAVAAWNFVKTRTSGIWNGIVNFFRGVWQRIVGIIGPRVQRIKSAVINAWNSVKARTSQIWNGIRGFFAGVWGRIAGVVGPRLQRIRAAVTNAWTNLKTKTSQVWNSVRTFFAAVWGRIAGVVGPKLARIRTAVTSAWNFLKTKTSQVWNSIKNFFSGVWNSIRDVVGPRLQRIKAAVSLAWTSLKTKTSQVWNSIKSFFMNIWNRIRDVVGPRLDRIKSAVKAAWEFIKTKTSQVWNGIKSFFQTVWSRIKEIVGSALSSVRTKLSTAWTNIKAGVSSAWNTVKTTISNGWTSIKTIVSDGISSVVAKLSEWKNNLYNLGRDAIQGLIDGIKNMAGAVAGAVGDLLSNAYQRGKDAIGAKSPSKKFADIGKWGGEGFIKGIDGIKAKVAEAGRAMGGGFVDSMKVAMQALSMVARSAQVAGRAIVDGLVTGARAAGSALAATMRQLAESALQAAKNVLGVRSPSRAFAAIGKFIPAGMAMGIRNNIGSVKSALGSMAEEMKKGKFDGPETNEQKMVAGFMKVGDVLDVVAQKMMKLIAITKQLAMVSRDVAASTGGSGGSGTEGDSRRLREAMRQRSEAMRYRRAASDRYRTAEDGSRVPASFYRSSRGGSGDKPSGGGGGAGGVIKVELTIKGSGASDIDAESAREIGSALGKEINHRRRRR